MFSVYVLQIILCTNILFTGAELIINVQNQVWVNFLYFWFDFFLYMFCVYFQFDISIKIFKWTNSFLKWNGHKFNHFSIIFQGGEVIQETIQTNLDDDSIQLEFQKPDGTLVTQLIDFRNVNKRTLQKKKTCWYLHERYDWHMPNIWLF